MDLALEAVRLKSASGNPARAILRAIPLPMVPSPTNPTRSLSLTASSFRGLAILWATAGRRYDDGAESRSRSSLVSRETFSASR